MYKELLLPVVCVLLFLIAGCAVNPVTGEEELMFYPEHDDITIGRKYAPEVEKQMKGRIANHTLQSYIDTVGQKIARVCHRPDLEYHFVALNHESLNALALPGGYIFITRGMLQKLTTEAQLAAILAHEVVHVVARDTSAALSRMHAMNLLVAGLALGRTPGGAVRMAELTRIFLVLRYSREDEKEADLNGLDYMVRAGYNPRGMVETMQILQKENTARPIEFFSTHPSPRNRLEYITEKIQTNWFRLEGLTVGKDAYQNAIAQNLKDSKRKKAS